MLDPDCFEEGHDKRCSGAPLAYLLGAFILYSVIVTFLFGLIEDKPCDKTVPATQQKIITGEDQ